jgi:hypothetical protein
MPHLCGSCARNVEKEVLPDVSTHGKQIGRIRGG